MELQFKSNRKQHITIIYLTDEIWNEPAIGKSPSGVPEEAFPIRWNIWLEISSGGIYIVIVSNIKYWIPKNE